MTIPNNTRSLDPGTYGSCVQDKTKIYRPIAALSAAESCCTLGNSEGAEVHLLEIYVCLKGVLKFSKAFSAMDRVYSATISSACIILRFHGHATYVVSTPSISKRI